MKQSHLWEDPRFRVSLIFTGLITLLMLVQSLVNEPKPLSISISEQVFPLEQSTLPLYSLSETLWRAVVGLLVFLGAAWAIWPERKLWEVGLMLFVLPPLAFLVLWADGLTTLLMLVAVVSRRFLPPPMALLPPLLIGAGALYLHTLSDFRFQLGGPDVGFSALSVGSTPWQEILPAGLLTLGQSLFMLAAFELTLRLSEERSRLQHIMRELQAAKMSLGERLALEERAQLSRELHDSGGHHLTALNLHAQRALILAQREGGSEALCQSLNKVRSEGQALARQLTEVVSALRTVQKGESLGKTMSELRTLIATWPAAVKLDTDAAKPELWLDSATRMALYRTCQELLTNASKHAAGEALSIKISTSENGEPWLHLYATNPLPSVAAPEGEKRAGKGGSGLAGLSERVGLLGGTLEWSAYLGEFRLRVQLPLPETGALETEALETGALAQSAPSQHPKSRQEPS